MPPTHTQSPPWHWSKDFAEHLRTIHFTLISVSTGLILIALSIKPYNPLVAFREIHQILELKKLWKPEWIASKGIKKSILFSVAATGNPQPSGSVDLSTLGVKEGAYIKMILPKDAAEYEWEWDIPLAAKSALYGVHKNVVVELSIEKNWWYQPRTPSWSPETFPTTLAEFRQWWDVLEKQHYKIVFPSDVRQHATSRKIKTDSPSGKKQIYRNFRWVISGREKPPTEKGVLNLMVNKDTIYYVGPTSLGTIRVNVANFVYTEVTQQMFVTYFGNWTGSSFDSSFSDLARAGHEFEALELEDVDKIVSNEASKGSEVVEAFGMKFPAAGITVWGVLILLGVQMYFVLYLRQLRNKLGGSDEAWDIPWLGMDTSRWARVVFFVSVFVLPLLLPVFSLRTLYLRAISQEPRSAMAVAAFFGNLHLDFWSEAEFAFLAVALPATAILGILSWKYRPQLLEPLPSSQSVAAAVHHHVIQLPPKSPAAPLLSLLGEDSRRTD